MEAATATREPATRTTMHVGELPRRIRRRRADISDLGVLVQDLQPGQWFVWPNSPQARTLVSVYRIQRGRDVNCYVHPDDRQKIVIAGGAIPPAEIITSLPTIQSGPLPRRVERPSTTSESGRQTLLTCPVTAALFACKPGEWFLIPESQYAKHYCAMSRIRERHGIRYHTFKTESGERCVVREPDSNKPTNESA
jgi:hypothetical protein